MNETTFTFRVDEALKTEFAKIAKTQDRSGAQLLRGFMRDYVEKQRTASDYDAWLRKKVETGRQSAKAGRLISNEEVEAKFSARRAATRQRLGAN